MTGEDRRLIRVVIDRVEAARVRIDARRERDGRAGDDADILALLADAMLAATLLRRWLDEEVTPVE